MLDRSAETTNRNLILHVTSGLRRGLYLQRCRKLTVIFLGKLHRQRRESEVFDDQFFGATC